MLWCFYNLKEKAFRHTDVLSCFSTWLKTVTTCILDFLLPNSATENSAVYCFFQELGYFLTEKGKAFLCTVTGPMRGMRAEGVIPNTGWGKSKLPVVHMENNTINK